MSDAEEVVVNKNKRHRKDKRACDLLRGLLKAR